MAGPSAFTDPQNWLGGCYELCLELGRRRDERLDRALDVLWRTVNIAGCYGERDREPADQPTAPATAASLQRFGGLYGWVSPPGLGRMVARRYAMYLGQSDRLTLGLPLGALGRIEPRVGDFPFGADGGPSALQWRRALRGGLRRNPRLGSSSHSPRTPCARGSAEHR